MPKDKLTQYSATNASNTDVGGVNIDEGMLRRRPQAGEGLVHGAVRRLKNIDLINHRRLDHGHGRDDKVHVRGRSTRQAANVSLPP